MTRVERSVNARRERRATLERAKGFRGRRTPDHSAPRAVVKANAYAYRDRRNRNATSAACGSPASTPPRARTAWTTAASSTPQLAGIELDREVLADIAVRDQTFARADAARERRPPSPAAERASLPARILQDRRLCSSLTLITSPHDEKLKGRRLQRRRDRRFVAEGEDLLAAAADAGWPARAPSCTRVDVEADLLDGVSAWARARVSVFEQRWAR